MVLPSEKAFLEKFLLAVWDNRELKKAYCRRFVPFYNQQTLEQNVGQFFDKLSSYGGYAVRRRLINSIPVRSEDHVLDIGPEMGMECFLLAEVYTKVHVAEPDAITADLLRGIAEHYYTEDRRKASTVLDIRRAGIIPPGSTFLTTNPNEEPSGLVAFDARGAVDIGDTFGLRFADRIFCSHIGEIMPAKPQLSVLLSALSSYCSQIGTITWCDEVSELSYIAVDYAKHMDYKAKRKEYYDYGASVASCPLSEIKKYIVELLPGFTVTFRMLRETGQLFTIAKRY